MLNNLTPPNSYNKTLSLLLLFQRNFSIFASILLQSFSRKKTINKQKPEETKHSSDFGPDYLRSLLCLGF